MLNLIIVYADDKWSASPASFERNRCLTEYMPPELEQQYVGLSADVINEIKQYPCIFAYEKVNEKDALIGYIKNVDIQQKNVWIDYELTGEIIAYEDLIRLTDLLDMGPWEWNRTHWTLKKASLEDIRPYFISNKKSHETVFVSYSWTPPLNQQNVFTLINRLENDGVKVIYDVKDLHPGQDMNYFMEKALTSNKINKIIIVCNKDYAKKADSRSGGVGYESELILTEIINDPMQVRYIPVAIEHDENGGLPLPTFLKTRNCIDLTQDIGYERLLKAIRMQEKDIRQDWL